MHRFRLPSRALHFQGPSTGREERSRQEKAAAAWQGSQNSVTGISQKIKQPFMFWFITFLLQSFCSRNDIHGNQMYTQ